MGADGKMRKGVSSCLTSLSALSSETWVEPWVVHIHMMRLRGSSGPSIPICACEINRTLLLVMHLKCGPRLLSIYMKSLCLHAEASHRCQFSDTWAVRWLLLHQTFPSSDNSHSVAVSSVLPKVSTMLLVVMGCGHFFGHSSRPGKD